MKLAKIVVKYYVDTTGNAWSRFYDDLDEALASSDEDVDYDKWLIRRLMQFLEQHGVSKEAFLEGKDVVKSAFDNESRKQAGEFFTPVLWAEELHRYMDKYIPNWRNDCYVWEPSAGSGNLIKTANIKLDHLFASTLQDDDVTLLKSMPELEGAEIFQLDFLHTCDDTTLHLFFESLPERLQKVMDEDKPLVILANPPYKSGWATSTNVGKFMCDKSGFMLYEDANFSTDFSGAAYDIFYQFCFQVMHLVALHELKNVYYCFFGPLTFFTLAGATNFLHQFEHVFEFVDGMCILAQEFSDTSDSIVWGVGATIWKSRGGYITNAKAKDLGIKFHKPILLDKKFITPDGGIGCEGQVLYAPPGQKLSEWVVPKDADTLVSAPILTSHLTFKGGDVFEKEGHFSAKIDAEALGTLMIGNTLTRSADQSAILSMPTTIQYVSITKENFWRCVSSYAFRRVINAGWAITKKEISAPDTTIEGYDVWLRNALVTFLFEHKSMMSAMRNVKFDGATNYCIHNRLFYLSEAEIREYCQDEVILEDLKEYPLENDFMLQQIKESEPYWSSEMRQLYDWCKGYTLATYNHRKTVNYKGSLECADAGFQQIRSTLWNANQFDADLTKLLVHAREYLRKDIMRFGFVSEVVEGEPRHEA